MAIVNDIRKAAGMPLLEANQCESYVTEKRDTEKNRFGTIIPKVRTETDKTHQSYSSTALPHKTIIKHIMLVYALDISLTVLAFLLGKVIFLTHQPHSFISNTTSPFVDLLILGIIWTVVFINQQVYSVTYQNRYVRELINVTLSSVIALICLTGVLYIIGFTYPVPFLIVFFVLNILLLTVARLALYKLAQYAHITLIPKQRVVIVGTNRVGEQVCQAFLQQKTNNSIQLIGFVGNTDSKTFSSLPVLGSIDKLADLTNLHHIHDVIIAPDNEDTEKVDDIVKKLAFVPVSIYLTLDDLTWALYAHTLPDTKQTTPYTNLGQVLLNVPLISLRSPELSLKQYITKRLFDLVLVLSVLPFVLPVMSLVALAIRLDSPGPILFKQKRMGEAGHTFTIYKFRSMVANAESLQHKVTQYDKHNNRIHKARKDPRVTRVGRLIRRTSLDELPQLFNVLKGDMSFIGPRPELLSLIANYQSWQYKRFSVPQGMTGWWQVNGRSDKIMHLNTIYDVYYVQNYSLVLDLQILLKTPLAVLKGRGAF